MNEIFDEGLRRQDIWRRDARDAAIVGRRATGPARCFNKTGRMALLPKIAEPRKTESPDNGVHLEIGSRQIVLPAEEKVIFQQSVRWLEQLW